MHLGLGIKKAFGYAVSFLMYCAMWLQPPCNMRSITPYVHLSQLPQLLAFVLWLLGLFAYLMLPKDFFLIPFQRRRS
jgi:hypothetical protein